MIQRLCIFLFLGFLCPAVWAAEPDSREELASRLREFDGRVILRGTLTSNPMAPMLSRYIAARLRTANERDRAAWQAVDSKADWEQLRRRRLAALRASLGQFPKVPGDLHVRVVRTLRADGFEVDNLVYQSRPGVIVTANLYRPAADSPAALTNSDAIKGRPGLIFCLSHIRPKEVGARQLMAATWARAGCVVLVPDHLGHGERRQHAFSAESDYDQSFRLSSQDYYFRYDCGIQLHLIGESLMGWLAWDLWRGVDVLLDQPGVDPRRIVMISEPAGGGDVAAVAGALDERIAGVMVNNFGGPEPENGYPLPPDAELSFPYTASGSWESTRNLRLGARDGFLPWTIVGSMAPRRLIYYHEFYWDRQQDPVWPRLERIYGFYGAADSLVGLAGHGFVVGSAPENTHWTPYSRSLLYPTLNRWFSIPSPPQEYDRLIPEEQLHCLTPPSAGKAAPGGSRPVAAGVSLHRRCSEIGAERASAARRDLGKLPVNQRQEQLRRQWAALLGKIEPAGDPVVRKLELEELAGIKVARIQLGTEAGIVVPVLLLVPEGDSPRRVVVATAQSGKQAFLRHRSGQMAELLNAGTAVCLADVRGSGETDPGDGRGRRSSATSISSSELLLGQTLLGARLRDVRQVIRYLRGREDLQADQMVMWGDSFAPVNAADVSFAVPRGIADRPRQSEPLGGLLALLTALFDERIAAVYVHGGLAGFQQVLDSPYCYVPHDVVVPGVLTAGDLPDVAAAIAPRPLRLDNLVDGLNRRQSAEQTRRDYAATIDQYRDAAAKRHCTITDEGPSISQWLLEALTK